MFFAVDTEFFYLGDSGIVLIIRVFNHCFGQRFLKLYKKIKEEYFFYNLQTILSAFTRTDNLNPASMISSNKIIFCLTLFFFQLGYAQKMVSFFDTTEYKDEKTQYILYKNKKFTGKYFVKFDTLKIVTSVKNGIITNREESGPAHKALYTVKNKDQYKKRYDADGNLREEGLLNDDDKDGEWKEYYSAGSVKSVMFYDKGKNIKTWSFFDANAEITKKIVFSNEVPFPESKNMNQDILVFTDLDVRKQNCRSSDVLDQPAGNPYLNCDSVYFYKGLKYTGYTVSGDPRIFLLRMGNPFSLSL